jgi:hypothetical protein
MIATVPLKVGNGGSVTDSNSITTTIDTVKPAQPAFSFEDTGSLNNLILIEFTAPMIATVPLKVAATISLALILSSSPIPFQTTEVDKLAPSTDTVISCSVLLPAISVATMVTL